MLSSVRLVLLWCFISQCSSIISPPGKHCIEDKFATSAKWGVIKNPGYPQGITRQTQCSWRIESSPKTRIRIAFQAMNLTGFREACHTQYVELWDIKLGSSQGRFCGQHLSEDYVSYGSRLRIDLSADTVSTPHEGFIIRFKSSRDTPGFKSKFSFPKKTQKKGKNQGEAKKPNKEKLPPKFSTPSNGGKVNLKALNKQRIRNQNNRNNYNATTANSTNTKSNVFFKSNRNQQQRDPYLFFALDNHNDNQKTKKTTKNVQPTNWYIVAGIIVGGLIVMVVIIYFMWRLTSSQKKRLKKLEEMIGSKKREQVKSGVYSISSISIKNHETDGKLLTPTSTIRQNTFSSDLHGVTSAFEYEEIPVRRGRHSSPPVYNDLDEITLNNVETSIQTNNNSDVHRQQNIPTLKRKMSEWEKVQIEKEWRKL